MWYTFSKRKLRLNICKYILKFTSFSLIICMIELENQLTYLLFKVLFVRSISNSMSTHVCTCISFRALNIWTRKRCLFRTKKNGNVLKNMIHYFSNFFACDMSIHYGIAFNPTVK